MIALIDYGMGNIHSARKAFEYLGFDCAVTDDADIIKSADKVVLPGVGAFRDAINTIRQKGLDKIIYEVIDNKKPFLGICIGMQLLFEKSYENGEHEGLGILPGVIKRLPDKEKIPHIGWNSLDIKKSVPLYKNLPEEAYVYFVHSYHVQTDMSIVNATCFYGEQIQAGVQKDNIYAVQFHPEKSGNVGLEILKNFGGL